jgi:hypothetical protein
LEISNKLFYEDELFCRNKTPKSILCMVNLREPLQFCHVVENQSRPKGSSSWRNDEEASCCVDLIVRQYMMGFEPDQIGIIAPFMLQARPICEKLEEKLGQSARFAGGAL